MSKTQSGRLKDELKDLVNSSGQIWCEELERTVPRKWQKHGDLLMIPAKALDHPVWTSIGPAVWETLAKALKCKRVAQKASIRNDDFRSPQVELLLGDDGWVTQVDNGIRYSFDVRRCMFSPGNISEKLRIAKMDCEGETVVDLYSGIGYFTLPYLVHAKANLVYACEWNPASIYALNHNLRDNGVEDRCHVLPGDNTQTCPRGVADRVNLGLIPSSEASWSVACAALNPNTGGILHIHANIASFPTESLEEEEARKRSSRELGEVDECAVDGSESCHEIYDGTAHQIVSGTQDKRNVPSVISSDSRNYETKGASVCKGSLLYKESIPERKCNISKIQNDEVKCAQDECKLNDSLHYNSNHNVSIPPRCCCNEIGSNSPHAHSDSSGLKHSKQQNIKHESMQKNMRSKKFAKKQSHMKAWVDWAAVTGNRIEAFCTKAQGGKWQTEVLHIEHVKRYAPHIDHVVLDLRCTPL